MSRGRDLDALMVLCRELAKLGVDVGISDARPAVSVRAGRSSPRWWVEVDASGQAFEWQQEAGRLPVSDPASAAARIAAKLKEMRAGSGGTS